MEELWGSSALLCASQGLALKEGTGIVGSRQVRREIQALRFCFLCCVTLLTQSKAAPN